MYLESLALSLTHPQRQSLCKEAHAPTMSEEARGGEARTPAAFLSSPLSHLQAADIFYLSAAHLS